MKHIVIHDLLVMAHSAILTIVFHGVESTCIYIYIYIYIYMYVCVTYTSMHCIRS